VFKVVSTPEISDIHRFMTDVIDFKPIACKSSVLKSCDFHHPSSHPISRSIPALNPRLGRSSFTLNMSFPNLGLGQLGSSPYFYNYPSLVPYANPPTNYLGTTLFLSYIFLALILTSYITITLFQRYQSTITFPLIASSTPPPRQIRDVRARHVKIYASLASISFAMLSYHMLNFLITNYGHWSGGAARMLRSWEGISRDVFVLKQWMLNSTLFEHFARELVDDGPSTVWMQVSVLGTWFCSMWMGGKGTFSSSSDVSN
jgi:hypothetical protein